MYQLIIPAMLLAGGVYFFIRNIRLLKDQPKLENYLETNAAGKRWVKHFGQEKAILFSKRYFLPLGIAIALAMVWFGGLILFKMLTHYL